MNLAVILVIVFVLAYVLIAMENRLNINKSSVALLLCCVMWSLLSLFPNPLTLHWTMERYRPTCWELWAVRVRYSFS